MSFQGSLAELHLPDIVQLMSVSGKTGVFHLKDGELEGQIYLAEGQIVHARLADSEGEEAVYSLAIWTRGDFRFELGVSTESRTIRKSNTNLLMEAARRLDEWRVLSKKIPSLDMVPEFVVLDGREGQINLNTGEWLILSKIDGRRSVREIAAACQLSPFEAAKMLYGLVATGLIRVKEAAAAGAAGGALRARLDRVRDACLSALGSVGEGVVAKHYQKALAEIEKGGGAAAVEEAIAQIGRATAILKGPQASEALLRQLSGLR